MDAFQLCSAPVGRVPLQSVLQNELAVLALFCFNIPFKPSAMTYLHVRSWHMTSTEEVCSCILVTMKKINAREVLKSKRIAHG